MEGSADNIVSAIILGFYAKGSYDDVLNWFRKLEIKDFRSYVLYISSMTFLGKEVEDIGEFVNRFGGNNFRKDIELFKFRDEKFTKNLTELIGMYLHY